MPVAPLKELVDEALAKGYAVQAINVVDELSRPPAFEELLVSAMQPPVDGFHRSRELPNLTNVQRRRFG